MNNLAYGGQDPAKVAPQIAELLQTDLGADAPLPYEVETTGVDKTTAGTVAKDALKTLFFGNKETLLFTVTFNIPSPRPAKLVVHLDRQGIGCHGGLLLYSTRLAKKVAGEASLEDPKMFGTSKFTGDAGACAKLNASKDLLKKAGALAVKEADVAGVKLSIPRLLKLVPDGDGAMLLAGTLGRAYALGFKMSLRSKEFFELAALVEAAV